MLWDMPRFFLHKGPAFRSFTATYVIMIYAPFDHFEGAKGRCGKLVALKDESVSQGGCHISKGKILGQGHTQKAGGLHAEMVALQDAANQGNVDAKEVVVLKDIYELLERAIDHCRDAGKVVFQIALKYA